MSEPSVSFELVNSSLVSSSRVRRWRSVSICSRSDRSSFSDDRSRCSRSVWSFSFCCLRSNFWLTTSLTQTCHVTEVQSKSFGMVTQRRHNILVLCAGTHTFTYWTSFTVPHVIFFIVECGIIHLLCTMRVLCVHSTFGIILSPRLPLFQFSFLSQLTLLS